MSRNDELLIAPVQKILTIVDTLPFLNLLAYGGKSSVCADDQVREYCCRSFGLMGLNDDFLFILIELNAIVLKRNLDIGLFAKMIEKNFLQLIALD